MWAVNAVRTSAHSAIDRLGPDDLATVIFTGDNRQPQDFTNDHAKLHAAAEKFGIGFDPSCIYYQHTIQTLTSIADYMAGLNQRRKAIMYISGGVPVDVGSNRLMVLVPDALPKECGTRLVDMMKDVFREAQKSNVAIYTIDPFGLRVDAHLDNYVGAQVAFLQTMAENTGGRAIVNTNDFERGLTQIFRENSAYYLVGYSPTNVKADGTFRRIEVKVDRPGVEVNTRKNYYAPAAEKPGDKPKPVPSPLQKAMGDVLPNADVPLQVTLAPFALPDPSTGLGAGGKTAAVAIALGVARPKDRMAARADDVDVVVKAFTPDGTERGTIHDTPHVSFMGASDGPLQFEVMSRIDLPPGPYEIRVSAHSAARDTTGSVYADVIVPDFAKEPLSLSGVALGLMPSPVAASRDALASLLPLVPTSQREFYRSDRVTAFLRVYEGGKSSIAPATIHTHIIDAHDATMFDDTTTIAATDFDAPTRAADDRFHVPIAKLAPGAYVLTFEAASGKNTARRDVRFSVK
jgi:VWFA-related protein